MKRHPALNRMWGGLVLALLSTPFGNIPAFADEAYDLVILKGRVMDPETMFDAVRNVGIKDGRIAIITRDDIAGKKTIDAKGHVVAPGFIDTHDHSMDKFAARMGVRDGLTSGMDLEVGAHNIAKWYAEKEDAWPINYGVTVSHEFARDVVHDGLEINEPVDATDLPALRGEAAKDGVDGWAETRSTLEQINQITAILDEGLRQGALGMGSTLVYMRNGVTTDEMFDAQRAAARYGRLTMPHLVVAGDNTFGVGKDGKLLDWDADYSQYAGHPRTAGSRAKVLRLARERDIPLMFTLSQLSYWHALHLGDAGIEAMTERGRMQLGMVADITVFDPENVTDNATYNAGQQGLPSTGIPYVIVNGQIVVNDSKVQNGMGRPAYSLCGGRQRPICTCEQGAVAEYAFNRQQSGSTQKLMPSI